ncbi:putative Bax inhibitor 1 [Lucilia cuprina]|uniref:Putative Bax inhibitor 1 n=1 Tax=Lucilia cuprina TaxID=7375 RepID=A0A0L0CL01_LUCCU|nr:putative Bax inhibitor 1 [Lucilia cuprina]
MAASMTDRLGQFLNGLNDKYEPHVRQHLAKVYMMLCGTAAITATGSMLQMKNIIDLGMLAAIGSLLLVLGLHFYRDNGKNYYNRVAMLYAFGFCSGQTMGPLLQYVVSVNPSIIVTALVGTVVTFASLSVAALLAERGQFLFLGGILVSVINTMTLLSILNMFFKSMFVQMGQLYIGVFVMAAFVLFDTQNIIEKVRIGNRDVVQHSLDLFFDVLSMFRRLLIILTQKEERRREDQRKRR